MMPDRIEDFCLVAIIVGMAAFLILLEDQYKRFRTRRLNRLRSMSAPRRYIHFR